MPQPDHKAYDPVFASEVLLPLYEKFYFFEIRRKEEINARLNVPIAIMALIVSAISFFFRSKPSFEHGIIFGILFYFFLVILGVSLSFALYYFWRMIFGYNFRYVKSLHEIDKTIKKLGKFNERVSGNRKRDIEHELNVFLIEQYRDSQLVNKSINKQKSGYFVRLLRSLFFSIIALIFTLITLITSDYSQNIPRPNDEEITLSVNGISKIINVEENAMNGEDNNQQQELDEEPNEPIWPEGTDSVLEGDVKPDGVKDD